MEYNFNTEHWKIVKKHWTVGFVCSSFDLLHPGHLLMLEDAQNHCSFLVVGLQVDSSVDRCEKNSPIQSYDERYIQLRSVKYIDEIIRYETDEDLFNLLKGLRPNIRILGSDWKNREDEIIGIGLSQIYFHDRSVHTYSTTNLRKRIYKAENMIKDTR